MRHSTVCASSRKGLAPLIDELKAAQLKPSLPEIHVGDNVRLGVLVVEGKGKSRTQRLDGTVIREAGTGSTKTITVRRIFQGVGIEMNFPVHSPNVNSIEVLRRGRVRRAKLYYLRDRTGKNARLKELLGKRPAKADAAAEAQ